VLSVNVSADLALVSNLLNPMRIHLDQHCALLKEQNHAMKTNHLLSFVTANGLIVSHSLSSTLEAWDDAALIPAPYLDLCYVLTFMNNLALLLHLFEGEQHNHYPPSAHGLFFVQCHLDHSLVKHPDNSCPYYHKNDHCLGTSSSC